MQDQPYCSLLLVAPFCDGACPGCQNTVLNDADVLDVSVTELAKTYRENPFVDGITVAGLEICLSGEEFVNDLVAFVKEAAVPRVTIYSRFAPNHPKLKAILARIAEVTSVEELYCKTGMFMQNGSTKTVVLKNVAEGGQTWTISLASANQEFHVLKGSSWQVAAA